MGSQICSATPLFLKHKGMSCICIQKDTLVKFELSISVSLSYLETTMWYLSKLHGSAAMILSTSSLESKEKSTRWSPMYFILNPVFVLHKGLNVFAMASRLIGRLVRNRATKENFEVACSDFRASPEPSFSDRERDFHRIDKSSILRVRSGRGGGVGSVECFPIYPEEKNLLAWE